MFHVFTGKITQHQSSKYLQNQFFGIEVYYLWTRTDGEFFLYPYLDDNKKSVFYYCFDSADQKSTFEDILKMNGIGPKTAFQIIQIPKDKLQQALKTVDVKFFQSIPGIGPKSAKKIVLELKWSVSLDDFEKIHIDENLLKSITKSLKNLGYDTSRIKEVLQSYTGKISKENMPEIIKRVIKNM